MGIRIVDPTNIGLKQFYAGFSFAPQTEHFPSAVIIGCLSTSFPQIPHFKIPHLPLKKSVLQYN
jgi:hypothetical protein